MTNLSSCISTVLIFVLKGDQIIAQRMYLLSTYSFSGEEFKEQKIKILKIK